MGLRVSEGALLRTMELSDPGGPRPWLPDVMHRQIEEPATRLTCSGKAKRGDLIGVEKYPCGRESASGSYGEIPQGSGEPSATDCGGPFLARVSYGFRAAPGSTFAICGDSVTGADVGTGFSPHLGGRRFPLPRI